MKRYLKMRETLLQKIAPLVCSFPDMVDGNDPGHGKPFLEYFLDIVSIKNIDIISSRDTLFLLIREVYKEYLLTLPHRGQTSKFQKYNSPQSGSKKSNNKPSPAPPLPCIDTLSRLNTYFTGLTPQERIIMKCRYPLFARFSPKEITILKKKLNLRTGPLLYQLHIMRLEIILKNKTKNQRLNHRRMEQLREMLLHIHRELSLYRLQEEFLLSEQNHNFSFSMVHQLEALQKAIASSKNNRGCFERDQGSVPPENNRFLTTFTGDEDSKRATTMDAELAALLFPDLDPEEGKRCLPGIITAFLQYAQSGEVLLPRGKNCLTIESLHHYLDALKDSGLQEPPAQPEEIIKKYENHVTRCRSCQDTIQTIHRCYLVAAMGPVLPRKIRRSIKKRLSGLRKPIVSIELYFDKSILQSCRLSSIQESRVILGKKNENRIRIPVPEFFNDAGSTLQCTAKPGKDICLEIIGRGETSSKEGTYVLYNERDRIVPMERASDGTIRFSGITEGSWHLSRLHGDRSLVIKTDTVFISLRLT